MRRVVEGGERQGSRRVERSSLRSSSPHPTRPLPGRLANMARAESSSRWRGEGEDSAAERKHTDTLLLFACSSPSTPPCTGKVYQARKWMPEGAERCCGSGRQSCQTRSGGAWACRGSAPCTSGSPAHASAASHPCIWPGALFSFPLLLRIDRRDWSCGSPLPFFIFSLSARDASSMVYHRHTFNGERAEGGGEKWRACVPGRGGGLCTSLRQ